MRMEHPNTAALRYLERNPKFLVLTFHEMKKLQLVGKDLVGVPARTAQLSAFLRKPTVTRTDACFTTKALDLSAHQP